MTLYDAANQAGLLDSPADPQPDDILSAAQAGALLDVSRERVIDFIAAGTLRATNVASPGRPVYALLRRDVEAFAAARGYPRSERSRAGRPRS